MYFASINSDDLPIRHFDQNLAMLQLLKDSGSNKSIYFGGRFINSYKVSIAVPAKLPWCHADVIFTICKLNSE